MLIKAIFIVGSIFDLKLNTNINLILDTEYINISTEQPGAELFGKYEQVCFYQGDPDYSGIISLKASGK